MSNGKKVVEEVLAIIKKRDPDQREFYQAAEEVLSTLAPALDQHPEYCDVGFLARLVEPERTIIFRVPWVDDKGITQINRGFRVQFNSAIGPYKGGCRFHPSVNLSVLKFLGFEQIFKNSLTGLPMGGGKGGADFDPKGKSDAEVMRFCQSFVTELSRHIGADTDVPAGDIGVGGREVGYMFGQYKRLRNEFVGVFTGKDLSFGGSLIRPEATGYGAVYFTREMLKTRGKTLEGLNVAVSGSGNVAQFAVQKLIELKAKAVTMSDSNGFIYCESGLTNEHLNFIMELKNEKRGRISEAAKQFSSAIKYTDVERGAASNPLWATKNVHVAMPCATQNEVNEADAKALIGNGSFLGITEGANMPSTPEAIAVFQGAKSLFGPAKAANAGGVATSGLEMSQNSQRLAWTSEEVDQKLDEIMTRIHANTVETAKSLGKEGDYLTGANVTGFLKVAKAMKMQGVV